jgi:hypothetical protein
MFGRKKQKNEVSGIALR